MASTDGSASRLIRYSRAALAAAADGGELVRNAEYDVPASSFVEVLGDTLYVGSFDAEQGRASSTATPSTTTRSLQRRRCPDHHPLEASRA